MKKLTLLLLLLASPAFGQYRHVITDAGSVSSVTCVSGCGGGASVAATDAMANPTAPQSLVYNLLFNGVTWDRMRGDTTNGVFVNIKANATDFATQTTLALIKTKTDNLDVLLSSRTKPADQQHVIVDSGAVTNTPPSNASTNITQLNSTTVDTNSGLKSAGTLRIVLATDQPALTNKLLVTPDSVALPANQSVNVAQMGGVATSMNTGVRDTGTQRVTIATNDVVPASQSGTWTDRVVGNAGAAIDAANNAAMPANAIATGMQTATIDTSPTAVTAGNIRYQLASTEGVTYVQEGGPKRFSCFLQAVTVLTQCQAAPAAGLRAYVTGAHFSNQAATVQTLDIVFGTGTNCGTGTTALTHKWQMGTNATTTSPQSLDPDFVTPLVPTAANAICVRPSAATAFGVTLTGYIAP